MQVKRDTLAARTASGIRLPPDSTSAERPIAAQAVDRLLIRLRNSRRGTWTSGKGPANKRPTICSGPIAGRESIGLNRQNLRVLATPRPPCCAAPRRMASTSRCAASACSRTHLINRSSSGGETMNRSTSPGSTSPTSEVAIMALPRSP